MELRELLDVLGLEVVRPEDAELRLVDLRVLLLRRDVAGELVRVLLPLLRGRVRGGLLELPDQVHHPDYGVGRHLRVVRVVDAARDVAVRVGDLRGGYAVERPQEGM